MRKETALSLLASSFILLASCTEECTGKQVSCPSFNDILSLQWIPYKENQQVIFNSSTVGNDTFNLNDVYLSSSYQSQVTGSRPFCTAQADFKTAITGVNTQPSFWISMTVNQNQFNTTVEKQTEVHIKENVFQGAGFSDTGLIKSYDYSLSHFSNTAIVGNKTFTGVQEIFIDTSRIVFKSQQIYKLWIAKNVGIVGYEEYHGNLWVKQ